MGPACLADFSAGDVRSFKRHFCFSLQGESSCLWQVVSGRVALTVKDHDDKISCLRIVTEGGYFGWQSLGSTEKNFPETVTILDRDTKLLSCDSNVIRNLLAKDPGLGLFVLDHVIGALAEWHDLSRLGFSRIFEKKISRLILYLVGRLGIPKGRSIFIRPITHGQLAAMIGTNREIVSKEMEALKRGRYLRYTYNGIWVSVGALERLSRRAAKRSM